MKKLLFIMTIMLALGSLCALTGYGISNPFLITGETLPVELSSFTVAATAQHHAQINWATQSESNLLGFYLYRSNKGMLMDAVIISPQIPAHNSSTLQRYGFTDMGITESGTYHYWLGALEMHGEIIYHGPVSAIISFEEVQDTPSLPRATGIKSIFPNPFNPSATILYQMENPAEVAIDVFNLRGQLVSTYSASHSSPGEYKYIFIGKDDSGITLPSGIYKVRFNAEGNVSSQKIVLMK